MSTTAPPDYSQVLKERDEFQRDVTAAGIAVEPAAPNTSYRGTAPQSCKFQSFQPNVLQAIDLCCGQTASRPIAAPAPQPLMQSPYPADKSGSSKGSRYSVQQPAPTPAMGYGATQNVYTVPQQQQVAGAPVHYYQNAAGTHNVHEYCLHPGINNLHFLLGHTISSPYPPNHPALQCLLSRDGRHHTKNYYGVLGVVIGILFFPLGCIW